MKLKIKVETIKQESSTYIASFLASFKLFCLFSFFFLCKNIESFVLCSQCRGKKVKQICIIKYDNISNRIDSKKKRNSLERILMDYMVPGRQGRSQSAWEGRQYIISWA